jgi:hypothetical protein
MTPLDYLKRYWNLEVPIENEQGTTQWITIKVACYRLGDMKESREKFLDKLRPNLNDKGEMVKVKVKSVYGEEEKTFQSRAEIAPFVAAPFMGKGSPEDMQIVLQLAVRYGLIGKTQQEIQNYCDEKQGKTQMGKNIGLDCNGFVGNFLWHTVGGHPWIDKPANSKESHTSTGIKSLLRNVGRQIKTMEDLVFNGIYVMGLVNDAGNVIDRKEGKKQGHVVISQPLTLKAKSLYIPIFGWKYGEFPSLQVVEATGRGKGLVESDYYILDVDKKGVFKVWRGSQQEQMSVQIYRVFGF